MKCEKCGNDYNSRYYFATETICRECFSRMSPEQQHELSSNMIRFAPDAQFETRVPFGRRFAATFIDIFIYSVINIGLMFYMGYFKAVQIFMSDIQENANDPEYINEILQEFLASQHSTFLLGQLVPLLYFSLELFIAASLGKLIMGISIADANGTRAEFSALLARYLTKNLSVLLSLIGLILGINFLFFSLSPMVLFVLLIGYFMILTKKRQAFHDMFSKTAVYKNEHIKEKQLQNTIIG